MMKTIWIITAQTSFAYSGRKKLVRAYSTYAKAADALGVISACEPRMEIAIEEVEIETGGLDLLTGQLSMGWDLATGESFSGHVDHPSMPESPAANFSPEPPPSSGVVVHDEPMPWAGERT